MKYLRTIAASFFLLPFQIHASLAEELLWTEQEFEQHAKKWRSNPDSHAALITICIEVGYSELDRDDGSAEELDRLNEEDAKEVVRETCRRFVKGVASGAISYKMLQEWHATGKATLPDWR